MPETAELSLAEIAAVLPHGPPFLFLERALLREREAEGFYTATGKEFFFRGHFKHRPVFPASLMVEALGQLAVLWLLRGGPPADPAAVFFASCDGVRCHRPCEPPAALRLFVKSVKVRPPAAYFQGWVNGGGAKIAFVEEMVLAFAAAKNPS